MPVTIRSATQEDQDGLVALWQACGLTVRYNDPATGFRFALGRAASDVLVGMDESGRVVGSVMVGHDGHRRWLYYVAAAPEARGRGIGREMVAAAEAWLE